MYNNVKQARCCIINAFSIVRSYFTALRHPAPMCYVSFCLMKNARK